MKFFILFPNVFCAANTDENTLRPGLNLRNHQYHNIFKVQNDFKLSFTLSIESHEVFELINEFFRMMIRDERMKSFKSFKDRKIVA